MGMTLDDVYDRLYKIESDIESLAFELYSEARGEHVKVVELDDVIMCIEKMKDEV